MISLVNFTRKEEICVGKPSEEPVISILRLMGKKYGWDIINDVIELWDDERCDNIYSDQVKFKQIRLSWPKVEKMWDQYDEFKVLK